MDNNIFVYFIIYSFLGWCLESVCKTIWEKKLINSGFLHGPVCPIYGFGAVIVILILEKISDNIFIVFIISTILLTAWEYIVAVLLEKIFKTKYWDYSNLKFNIQGRVCLKNSIYWGILGVIFSFVIHPFIQDKVLLLPQKILFPVTILIYIVLLADIIVSSVKVLFIDKKIEQLHEISIKLKEKIKELKQAEMFEKVSKESIITVINELKFKQEVLKAKLYKLTTRLKKAFPTMQSEAINKLKIQKIDVQAIKDKIRKNKGV